MMWWSLKVTMHHSKPNFCRVGNNKVSVKSASKKDVGVDSQRA